MEHLPPEGLEMIKLAASRLSRNGVIAIETPNPECLAIFATHLPRPDAHTPGSPSAAGLYLEEFGIGNSRWRGASAGEESMASLDSIPEDFRDAFFGSLDLRDHGPETPVSESAAQSLGCTAEAS